MSRSSYANFKNAFEMGYQLVSTNNNDIVLGKKEKDNSIHFLNFTCDNKLGHIFVGEVSLSQNLLNDLCVGLKKDG